MGRLVKIDGVPRWDARDVVTVQDSTPLDPADTFGGTGVTTFTIPPDSDAKSLTGNALTILDSDRGTLHGVVAAIGGSRANVGVRMHARMIALVVRRTAQPHVGTIESLLQYYGSLCGVAIVVDPSIADVEIVAPGWYGNVWEQIKNLGAAYDFEVAPVGEDIVARPPRSVTASRLSESQFMWSLDESQVAQSVEAWYYPVAQITDELVLGNGDISPQSNIDAGEVSEFDVRIDASLSSVVQPVPVLSVAYGERSASVYSILDQFDRPVSPAAWTAGGGSVTVTIGPDTRSLHVRIVGSQNRMLAPYRMTGVALSGSEYSTLRVLGSGVHLERKKYTLPLNAAALDADEVGAEVDNYFLNSWGHAHLRLLASARRHGRMQQRISGSATNMVPATLVDGQVYGNVAGARIFEDHDVYRIRVATFAETIDWQAESDLTFPDVNAVNAGHTVDQWNDLWEGRPVSEYNLRPLSPLSGVVTPPEPGLYPGALTFPSSTTFPGA